MSSATPALMAVEMPPLRAETPENRCGHVPAAETAARMSSEIIWREQGRPDETTLLPAPRVVLGKSGGHKRHRAAGCRRLSHSGCTLRAMSRNHVCSWATMSAEGSAERPSVGLCPVRPFRVVLTIGDVDRAGALVALDAVAREMSNHRSQTWTRATSETRRQATVASEVTSRAR